MRRGFLYLVAIMDWASREVLVWRLSNIIDSGFCDAALEEALARFGKPKIFNTDQESQFINFVFTSVLREAEVRISMDGRRRWMKQRLYRAALAPPDVRMRLSAYVRGGFAVEGWSGLVSHLSKHPASALEPCRQNASVGRSAERAIKSWGICPP